MKKTNDASVGPDWHGVHVKLADRTAPLPRNSERRTVSVIYRQTGPDRNGNPTAEWIIEWPSSELTFALSPEQALVQIKTWSENLTRRLKKNIITLIDWYGIPPEFAPPSDVP